MTFNKWLDTLVAEKGIHTDRVILVDGPSGQNHMPLEIVLDAIKATAPAEQAQIKATLVKIDFVNGDVMHFFEHLAKALAI